MSLIVSPTLSSEMDSLLRRPASQVTVEQYMPSFTARISGLSAGKLEQYAHGHAACTALNGNGVGEDILFRARSGSFINPQDGVLYVAVIKGADLANPAGWDSLFVSSGLSGLCVPAWSGDTDAGFGASIAAVHDGAASRFRVFYLKQDGSLCYRDFSYTGADLGGGTLATVTIDQSLQLAAAKADELFLLRTELVEPGYAAWHKPVYGAKIYRYYLSGSWQVDGSFHFHTHAEAGLLKDAEAYDANGARLIQQWGKRPCGGLAVNEIDANTVSVSFGQTFWRRWGYSTPSQGLQSYLYYRDSGGIWRRNFESGVADWSKEMPRTSFDVFARGSQVEGQQLIVWSRNDEPLDREQVDGAELIPRLREVVYALIDSSGRHLTQFQSLGPQDDLTSASIVVVNHAGAKKLYALGWRAVYESPAASLLCSVPQAERTTLDLNATGYQIGRNNQWGMQATVNLKDASILFLPGTRVVEGNLLRVYHGIADTPAGGAGEQLQIGQGYLDLTDPALSVQARQHSGKILARADKLLLDTRAESFEDILPQNVRHLPPDQPIKYVSRHNGFWELVKAKWPALFFPGQYLSLVDKMVYELGSSMEAFTGGGRPGGGDTPPDQYGGGGKVWEMEPHKKGSFFSDVTWLAHDPAIDGAVQATVRMGDNTGYGNFEFTAGSGCPVGGTIIRQNGHIQRIDYSTHGCPAAPDGIWNRVYQESTMAGLITRAIQIGKKYAFVWEANSDFANASHLEDQAGRYWNSLVFDAPDFGSATYPPNLSGTKGANKLYLLISDYDEENPNWAETTQADRALSPNWQNEQLWLHRYIAGGIDAQGLTVGQPADLKMQVLGGTIHCFYRPYTEPGKSLWRHAFSHNAGHHSAGKFGIVGRGHSTIYWDVLWPGREHLTKTRNTVDFWDIHLTDGVEDRTMEEILAGHAWQGLTATEFRSFVDTPSVNLNAGQRQGFNAPPDYSQPVKIENLTINFDLTIASSGGEAGAYLKATDPADPLQDCVYLGLVVNSTYKQSDNTLNCYAVYRRFQGGTELAEERDYSPSALHLKPGSTLPVRITVRDRLYSIWVAGNYLGHFGKLRESEEELRDATAEYRHFGLYTSGSSATFANVHVPELFEIPSSSLLDINQAMKEAMAQAIGKRRIKGVFRPNGQLLLSYFDWHDVGATFQNSLRQNQYLKSDRFVSVCHVEGAYTHAVYSSPLLLARGRRFLQYHNPDLLLPEHCWREAWAIVKEYAERMEQASFIGLPDVRLEPEDQAHIIVAQQGINGDFLVDDVEFTFDLAERKSYMKASTRKAAV